MSNHPPGITRLYNAQVVALQKDQKHIVKSLQQNIRMQNKELSSAYVSSVVQVAHGARSLDAAFLLSPDTPGTCGSSRRRRRRTYWARRTRPTAGTIWNTTDATRCSSHEATRTHNQWPRCTTTSITLMHLMLYAAAEKKTSSFSFRFNFIRN